MRNSFLDTCKAVLIFLVVFGHFLEYLVGWSFPNSVLLGSIYFVHMPAFVFISGVLFKDNNLLKNSLFFLALYVPFQILFPLFNAIWSDQIQINWNLFERPYWILWYLMGMIAWTWVTHFLVKTRYPLAIAVILALSIGFIPWSNYLYSLGRICVFLPFFVAGHLYGKQCLALIQKQKNGFYLGIFILCCIALIMAYTKPSQYWLYGSLNYQQLHVDGVYGVLIRLACMAVSSLGIYAILLIAQQFGERFVTLGMHTLAIYLFHGFVVIAVAHYFDMTMSVSLKIICSLILSLFTCWIFQHSIFDTILRKLSFWLTKPAQKMGLK